MRLVIAAASAFAVLASAGAARAACTFDMGQGLNTQGAGVPYPGAEGRDWFMKKTPIQVAGARYEPYGLPRELGAFDFGGLERAGVYSGVMVFAEKGQPREVIYVPVNAQACSFQPYQKAAQ